MDDRKSTSAPLNQAKDKIPTTPSPTCAHSQPLPFFSRTSNESCHHCILLNGIRLRQAHAKANVAHTLAGKFLHQDRWTNIVVLDPAFSKTLQLIDRSERMAFANLCHEFQERERVVKAKHEKTRRMVLDSIDGQSSVYERFVKEDDRGEIRYIWR